MKAVRISVVSLLLAAGALSARAGVAVTEVAPWSSGNSPVAADWFELTNTGSTAIDITGWTMDDDSATPGVAPLAGLTSIGAGRSVIFIEGNGSATSKFITTWFGGAAPAGLLIGSYTGGGVGLGAGGDAVNIFNAAGVLQAGVSFGASPTGPYATFDNAAGLNGAITTLSAVGINGAFAAAGDAAEIGSPGAISAVPEPQSWALMVAGVAAWLAFARRSAR